MKKFLVQLARRTGRTLLSLVSVKTIPAVISSVVYVKDGGWVNATFFAITWALVVGFRYAEKVKGLLEKPLDGGN